MLKRTWIMAPCLVFRILTVEIGGLRDPGLVKAVGPRIRIHDDLPNIGRYEVPSTAKQ